MWNTFIFLVQCGKLAVQWEQHTRNIDSISCICVRVPHRTRDALAFLLFLLFSFVLPFLRFYAYSPASERRSQLIDEKWNLGNSNFTHTTKWSLCVCTLWHTSYMCTERSNEEWKRNGMLVFEQFLFDSQCMYILRFGMSASVSISQRNRSSSGKMCSCDELKV